MKKLALLLFLLAFAFSSSLNARSTFKGQKVYLKECRTCHMGSKIFLNTHTYDEWNKVLDDDGSSLSHIHLSKNVKNVNSKDGTIKDSHSYFKSDKYHGQYKNLKHFIIKFAEHKQKNFYKD